MHSMPSYRVSTAGYLLASPENLRCTGIGGGGSAPPRRMSVRLHHAIMMTTITVVTCMMRRASSLDSWMPRVFRHQK